MSAVEVVGQARAGVRAVWAEVAWLAGAVLALLRAVPAVVLAWAGGALLLAAWAGVVAVALWATLPYAAWAWARFWPQSFEDRVSRPWQRRRIRGRVVSHWSTARDGAGLPETVELTRCRWRGDEMILTPTVPPGLTVEDFEDAADRLGSALRAERVRVIPTGPGRMQLGLLFFDPLSTPFATEVPAEDAAPTADEVVIGRREDGLPWRWQVGVSTLTAGASGSGKGSLLWGLVIALAPAVKAGTVRLVGIDLKGGMELAMGRELFADLATVTNDAISLLEGVALDLRTRSAEMAGVTRQHSPSSESPQVVVIVDELAALIAYAERKDRERAEAALNIILSQGRAVGFTVMAFVQDPKKEVVKARGLFPVSLGLRLRGREEVAMVLGDGMRAAGAKCDRIARTTPGVGYIVPDGESRPVRVRAGWVSDEVIRATADRFGNQELSPGRRGNPTLEGKEQ